MASLKNLSDDELRSKLREHGITSPVTASSRNILLKKLNHAIANIQPVNEKKSTSRASRPSPSRKVNGDVRNNANKPGRKSKLINFSSDEDDTDYDNLSSERNLRRSSRNSSDRSARLKKKKEESDLYDNSNNDTVDSYSSMFDKKRLSPISFSHLKPPSKLNNSHSMSNGHQYDTGSDSDLDANLNPNTNLSRQLPNTSWRDSTSKPDYQYKNFNKGFDLRVRNSRFPLILPTSASSIGKIKWNKTNACTPPILKETEITSADDVVSHESLTPSIPNGRIKVDPNSSNESVDECIWLQSVPLVLLLLLAIFFIFLGLCYINIHTPILPVLQGFSGLWASLFNGYRPNPDLIGTAEPSTQDEELEGIRAKDPISVTHDQNKFPICDNQISMSCLSQLEMSGAQDILALLSDTIAPALREQAGLFQCGASPHHYLSIQKMRKVVKKVLLDANDEDIVPGLYGLGKLSRLNPHWGLDAVFENGVEDNIPELIGFASSAQPREILCHITKAMYAFGYFLIAVFCVLLTAWISFRVARFYKKHKEESEQKSFELVEQILEVLENSCGTEGKEFIAVNHVRDCLIPPRQRKAKSRIWEKAVTFIDDHDSRVYREVRTVGGEECEVWRWVSGAPRSPIACQPKTALSEPDECQSAEKVWQGQAFENQENTQNIPAFSPTSCLKIRNMFDGDLEFGDEWPRRIQDSLLEKCEGIDIIHIAVDRASKEGCVYLKCATPKDAGIAYKALHGWWFDRNLVTVKFLRDERYHERFPTARHATTFLKPSNNDRRSLLTTLSPMDGKNKKKMNMKSS